MPVSSLLPALAIGLSLGLFGGGGSILTVPALVYWAGLPPFEAISSSLVVVGLTSFSGALQHALRGHLRLRAALLFAATGIPGSYLGSLLSRRLDEPVLMLLFAGVMVAAAVAMLLRQRLQPAGEVSVPRILIAGLFVGVVTGFFGVGGGFLVVPTLVVFARVPVVDAVGTSLAVIACNCAGGFVARLASASSIHWTGTLAFAGVAIAGSFAGAALAGRLSSDAMRRSFAVFVLGVAVFIVIKTGRARSLPPPLLPSNTLGWAARIKDPERDPLPADAARADEIRRGYRIFLDTRGFAGADLSCGSCHLNAGQKQGALPLIGIATAFPEYNKRSGRMFTLADRIVGCFLRSLNSPAGGREHENASPQPPPSSAEVRALVAYLEWLSLGVTKKQTEGWRQAKMEKLVPLGSLDPARGQQLFAERCSNCHGADGQGTDLGELKPGPLWGERSWNDGAGVSRIYTLAGFLRQAMPYTAPGTLSDEEAQQIAAFITSRPRPIFAAKDLDYLTEPLPKDAVYYKRAQGETIKP